MKIQILKQFCLLLQFGLKHFHEKMTFSIYIVFSQIWEKLKINYITKVVSNNNEITNNYNENICI